MRVVAVVALAMLLTAGAQAADVPVVLAKARKQIEAADYRAAGRLVTVDAEGKRTSYALTVKARWFPGVLRVLVEIVPPAETAAHARPDERMSILLEMRPGGQNAIRIARSHAGGLGALPFEKWDESLFGGVFSYEDFLESQYYWPNQTILKTATFGARQCDVLKSTPAASDRTHFAQVETWLDRTIAYPVYAEKTLKGGGVVKQFTYMGLRQTGGVWSATQIEAKVRGRAGSTVLIVQRGSAKANLNAKDFSPEQIGDFEDRP